MTLIFCEFELFSGLSCLIVHVTGVEDDALESDEADKNNHTNSHIHVDLCSLLLKLLNLILLRRYLLVEVALFFLVRFLSFLL